MPYLRDLRESRELLGNLVARELKGQYRRTVFGQLWSLLNPVATMLIYTIVFSVFLGAQPPRGDPSGLDVFALWLMAGLLPWLFVARVVNGCIEVLIGNESLIKKVYFPRAHLPLSVLLSVGVTWLIEMVVLGVALSLAGAFVVPWLPLTLVVMVLLGIFAVGLGMLAAIANAHFRDTQHLVAIALQMWFYLTPIVYPLDVVANATRSDPWAMTIFQLNPMEHFVAVFRDLMYASRWPDSVDLIWCVCSALVVGMFGFVVFTRSERRLAEIL
ncbi:MAG: ABC transporter permease [Pseudolysinimonas sp.]|uniref:ABC transporter permease n=1 Tax=Pseudolysinimonas sp. TaxID=2680009 RepID=UPI003265BF74